MAKGIRSKRMQRTKALKRNEVRKVVHPKQFELLGTVHYRPKNAFLHPDDPEAVFPQAQVQTPIDFRSDAITPFAVPVKSQRLAQSRQPLPEREALPQFTPSEPDSLSLTELKATLGSIENSLKKKRKMRLG